MRIVDLLSDFCCSSSVSFSLCLPPHFAVLIGGVLSEKDERSSPLGFALLTAIVIYVLQDVL
jgi:hypothetical protein